MQDRRGSVLVFCYLVVAGLIALGSAIMVRGATEQRAVQQSRDLARAFQLAETGLDQTIVNLRVNNSAHIPSTAFMGGTYWAEISSLGNSMYQISAHGLIGQRRDIEAVVQQTAQSVFRYPLFGEDRVDLKKGAFTDSYDSSQAPYDPHHPGLNGTIATNNTAHHSITLKQGTAVNGQVSVGPGMANPSDAVDSDGTAMITGTPPIVSATQALVFSPVDTTGMSCGTDLDLPKNATFTFYESSSPYCYYRINADKDSVIAVSGNVKVYADRVDFDKSLSVNASGNPPQFLLFIYGTHDVMIDKEGTFVGAIYAPDARVRLKKEVQFYGALMAEDVEIDKESRFHYDEALKSSDAPAGSYKVAVQAWRDF